jgi:beta-phosphoglucomutase-like phosphatase (HAD superfamily)
MQEGARDMDMNCSGQYQGPVRLAIFDWAGTTVDHGCFAPATVFIEVFGEHGIELSMAQAREPMGMDKRDHIKAIMAMPAVAELWHAEYGRDATEQDIDALFGDLKMQKSGSSLSTLRRFQGCWKRWHGCGNVISRSARPLATSGKSWKC